MAPQTDIIVPIHDALEYTKACIDSLFAHTKNFRLILVDDFSQPETTAYLMGLLQKDPTMLYVRTAQQKWWTRASNIGLRLVRTQRCMLLNSDCVVDEGWLDELYDVWADAEAKMPGRRIGLVGSHLSAEEQRRWFEAVEPGYVTGHCLLLSMPILAEMADRRGTPGWYFNELDVQQIHIASDRILCWDMNRVGYATITSLKSAVGHHGGRSWGHQLSRLSSLRIGDPLKGEIFG